MAHNSKKNGTVKWNENDRNYLQAAYCETDPVNGLWDDFSACQK